MPSWSLENADLLAAEYKYTFYKPARDVIAKVQAGEVVKLIFNFESDDPEAPGAERMWVLVDEVSPDGRFQGRLNNEPYWIKDLRLDDPVEFDASHIIATEHGGDEGLVGKYAARCFVTNRILQDGAKAGYLYREEPEQEDDSGWRILAGDESSEYMDESGNARYVSLGAVLKCDDSIIHLLDAAPGAAFGRNAETMEFISVARDS
jgi:hypothetical protein